MVRCATVGTFHSAWRLSLTFPLSSSITVMPDDSYASDFIDYRQKYTERSPVSPYAYFRYVDQYQDDVRNQMKAYVEDLVTIEAIPERPPFFWVEDFQEFVQNNTSLGNSAFRNSWTNFWQRTSLSFYMGHTLFAMKPPATFLRPACSCSWTMSLWVR